MKTNPQLVSSKFGWGSSLRASFTLAAASACLASHSYAGNIEWQGGTASYNTPADWVGGVVPSTNDVAINDSGLNNVVQINFGNPDWVVSQILAGAGAGNGAFAQNGQNLILSGLNLNGSAPTVYSTSVRLGAVAGDTGAYTLTGGTNNFGSGAFNVGELGSATLNIGGGVLTGTGILAINNGIPGAPMAVNATVGAGFTEGDFTWFEQGYDPANTAAGIPHPGTTITSLSQADHSFVLPASYTANNDAVLSTNSTAVTISPTAPVTCSGLSFLCTSGNGASVVNYTVHHASGPSETGSLTIPDWFGPGSANEVLAVGSRVDALGFNFQFPGSANGLSGNAPYIWSLDITVTNASSAVTSVDFSYVSGGYANIFGLSASTGSGFTPVTITGFNRDVVVEAGAQNIVSSSVTDTATQTNGTVTLSGGSQLFVGNFGHGTYSMSGGSLEVGAWFAVGRSSGTGTFTLDNGTVTQDGNNGANVLIGTGYQNVNGAPATGVFTENAGTFTVHGQFLCPENAPASGTYNLNGGTNAFDSWFVIGRGGGTGVMNMTGGSIYKNGNGSFIVSSEDGGPSIGTLNMSGGTITSDGEFWIANGGSANGTNNMSGTASITVNNWVAIGRGGNGVLNMTGGALTKTGNGGNHLDLAGFGNSGTINQSGGGITNLTSDTWLGETGTGTWNMNGGYAALANVLMAVNSSASSYLNLNGGVMQAAGISSPSLGVSVLNFNGGVLQANANNDNFISNLGAVNVAAGGAVIDTQGYTVGIQQALADNGGGLTKLGSGTLSLLAANSYSGSTVVNAGTLVIGTSTSTGGGLTVADNATFSLEVQSANAQFNAAALTFGSSQGAALNIDLGAYGNPTVAPINTSGTLTANGTVTVSIADGLPSTGQFPLITYGSQAGSGTFVLGSIPVGLGAYLSNNVANHSIDLVISNVNLPRWEGLAGGTWDLTTTNWINIGSGLPTTFGQGNAVTFNDSAQGVTTVNLTTTVNPNGVTVNNSALPYTFTGSGKIGGNAGLTKQGSGNLTIANTSGNTYTGSTVLGGGSVIVSSLANGGTASAIGASTASPTNLVLAGGNLTYTGPAVSINRGYTTVATNSSVTVSNNVTLSGSVTAGQSGGLAKYGLAQLHYTSTGSNTLTGTSSPGYVVQDGSVLFDGVNGGQTNAILGTHLGVDGLTSVASATVSNATIFTQGNLDLGDQPFASGSMSVNGTNSTVNIGSWFIFGNGGNNTNTFTLNSGTINNNNGYLLMGGSPGGLHTLNINGGVLNQGGGIFDIGDGGWNGSGARTGVVNQVGGTINSSDEIWVGQVATGVGIFNLSNGTINLHNWLAVGRSGGNGTFNMTGGTFNKDGNGAFITGTGGGSVGVFNQSGGTINVNDEFWTAESGAFATNNISGTAVVNVSSFVTVGRNGTGVVNMSGGSFTQTGGNPFFIGIFGSGVGIWNQLGGSLSISPVLHIGDGSSGTLNVSGGTINVGSDVWVGQGGSGVGTMSVSGGAVTNNGWLAIGRESARGVLNISGGIMVKQGGGNISIGHNGGGSATVNMTGGTFICATGETWVGENGTLGTWNMTNGNAIFGTVRLAENADAQGVLNLSGGTVTANEITTGNTGASQRELDLNGGTVVAGIDNTNFIHDLTAANVEAGGAIFDTAGHTVWVNQALLSSGGDGGLLKKGNGTLYLNGVNTYANLTQVAAGALGGSGTIAGPVTVASGAALKPGTSAIGTLAINNSLTLASGSSTFMKISLAGGVTANDQVTGLTSVTYAGSLVVSNAGGTILPYGAQFKLFNAASSSGNFSSVTVLPAGSGTFNPATGILTITSPGVMNPPVLSGGKVILTASGLGMPGANYTLLSTTNVTTSMANWVTNSTGLLDASGGFSNAIPVGGTPAVEFFRARIP